MMKKTVYEFLKRKYPKHLILFSKNDKINPYQYDYELYQKYSHISYIIVNEQNIIKRDYPDNQYDYILLKYKLKQILKKVGKK